MNSRDKLWMGHKGSAFPLVAEAIQEEVEAYKNSEDEIRRLKHAMVRILIHIFFYFNAYSLLFIQT